MTFGFAQITQKNCAKTLHAQKMRTNSQKKYLRENYANFAQKILAFRGNPN